MADQPANLLPRGVEYRGSDPFAREAFAIVNTFMQRMRAKEASGAFDLVEQEVLTGAATGTGDWVFSRVKVMVQSVASDTDLTITGTDCV